MRICLTGATGFIGSHLCKRLLEDGHVVGAIVRKPEDAARMRRENFIVHADDGDDAGLGAFLAGNAFEGIVHLAAVCVAEHKSEHIVPLLTANIVFGTRVLEQATRNGVAWMLNVGTFWQHNLNAPNNPANLYAATKTAFEDIARFYYQTRAIRFASVKLNDTFGPDDTRRRIVNLWKEASESGNVLDMSPGEQLIDLLFIDDVVDGFLAVVRLLANPRSEVPNGTSFALKSEERMPLRALAKVFEQVSGRPLRINWGGRPYRDMEVMVPWETGTPPPGWRQKVPLARGMAIVLKGDGAA